MFSDTRFPEANFEFFYVYLAVAYNALPFRIF